MTSEAVKEARRKNIAKAQAAINAIHWSVTDAEYIERMKSRCEIIPGGCWLWKGFLYPNGYGAMGYRGKCPRVHRLSYELHKGPIPDGYDMCHTCDVRNCVNPDHLFAGTRADNVEDMRRKGRGNKQKKTHCPKGHPYSGENLHVTRKGHRVCNACMRAINRKKLGWPDNFLFIPPQPKGYTFNRQESFSLGKLGEHK